MASLVLLNRLPAAAELPVAEAQRLQLSLSAEQRTSLRGQRRCVCGQEVLLQLPRDNPLQPGERLLTADGRVVVEVLAAPEPLLRVASADPLALLQAAYHLGNRHVALELHPDHLLLLHDCVLEDLLQRRGLQVDQLEAPFEPEAGAYASGHGHHH